MSETSVKMKGSAALPTPTCIAIGRHSALATFPRTLAAQGLQARATRHIGRDQQHLGTHLDVVLFPASRHAAQLLDAMIRHPNGAQVFDGINITHITRILHIKQPACFQQHGQEQLTCVCQQYVR